MTPRILTLDMLNMIFPERVITLHKQKGRTQQQLADKVGVRVLHTRRYESGAFPPTQNAIRRPELALKVTTDELVFNKDEWGPDKALPLQFEAVTRFTPEEKKVAKTMIGSLSLKHDANLWLSVSGS